MFDKYTKLVLFEYEKKLKSNALSLQWTEPTSAKIKEECFIVCSERFSRRDGKVLKAFFKEGNDKGEVLRAIKKCNPDIFKPLLNYLNKKTGKTAEKNIELLAWLIDFERRPYTLGEIYDYDENEGTISEVRTPLIPSTPIENGPKVGLEDELIVAVTPKPGAEDNRDTGRENPPQDSPVEDPWQEPDNDGNTNTGGGERPLTAPEPTDDRLLPLRSKRRTKYLIPLAVLIFLLLGGGMLYKGFKNTAANTTTLDSPALPVSEFCMYWAEDHYQQIPCGQASDSLNPIPLDMEKVQHFKKIPCPETIKKTEIGKYWYCKLKNGEVEFYTAGGFHPVDTQRRLKPLTNYMYEKYIPGRTPCP